MTLVPINLPPGFYKNGTPYSGKNRWRDGNLVRWHDGSLRPIGGWTRLKLSDQNTDLPPLVADPAIEAIRDGAQWRTNTGSLLTVFGSNAGLYVIDATPLTTDVTPAGFVAGPKDPALRTGYGTGPYGRGPYGVGRRGGLARPEPALRWDFDNWGEDMLATTVYRPGPIYAWSPGDAAFVAIPGAPTDVSGMVVTDQRIVMAIGSETEARRVRWSSREDRGDWIADIADEAGGYTLPGSGDLMSINKVMGQVLILSESDGYVGRWLGAPYIYGFDRIGDGCSPLHGNAVVVTDRFAMWPGRRVVWMYDGTLRQVPCEVMDFWRADISLDNASKMSAFEVRNFNEVWWLYQSVGSTTGDVDSYIAFDYIEGHWTTGRLDRTCSVHPRIDTLMMTDLNGAVWEHEREFVRVENAYAETGPLEIGNGDVNMAVADIFPDAQSFGEHTYTLYGRAMPTEPEYTYGPYEFANPINTRAMGREIRMRVDGLTNRWEVGSSPRFKVRTSGTGKR